MSCTTPPARDVSARRARPRASRIEVHMTVGAVESHTDENALPHPGNALVLQPEEGKSFWQPQPANGYATVKISPENCSSNFLSMGIQAIAENGYVREHWHSKHEEILFCYEGRGEVVVDGTV